MGTMQAFPGVERLIPFTLFALYMITAFRLCRYSSWMAAGAPNPFLPRQIKAAVSHSGIDRMIRREVRTIQSRFAA